MQPHGRPGSALRPNKASGECHFRALLELNLKMLSCSSCSMRAILSFGHVLTFRLSLRLLITSPSQVSG